MKRVFLPLALFVCANTFAALPFHIVSNPEPVQATNAPDMPAKGRRKHTTVSFRRVKSWVITLTAVTTVQVPVSKAKAKQIEASKADEPYIVEIDGMYYSTSHEMVPTATVVIKDTKFVAKLNALMEKKGLEEYRKAVKVKNGVAYAKWYNGNRGGGIYDDFPNDIVEYIETLATQR